MLMELFDVRVRDCMSDFSGLIILKNSPVVLNPGFKRAAADYTVNL